MHSTAIDKPRYPLATSAEVARNLCHLLAPLCERVIIAGSIRRCKSTVGDIEILYIPRYAERQIDLLSTTRVNLADELLDGLLDIGHLAKRLSKTGGTAWGDKNKLGVHVPSGIPVDFFATTEDAWHNYLVCRTGPAASNQRLATAARQLGYKWHPYSAGFEDLAKGTGKIIPMTSEEAVFAFAGLPCPKPEDRQ